MRQPPAGTGCRGLWGPDETPQAGLRLQEFTVLQLEAEVEVQVSAEWLLSWGCEEAPSF